MLRLRESILSHLLSSPSTPAISPLRRRGPHFSAVVEDYLVDTCGLTRPQALKASTKLSHLKSPANPNAALAFLSGLGLSGADAAAVVNKDLRFLCANVDKNLSPVVDGLTGLGLSSPEIGRLVSVVHKQCRYRSIVSKLHYYLPLFGSFHNFHRALQRSSYLVSSDLDKVVRPNVMFLQECGLGACDIAKLCVAVPWMLTTNPERVRAMVTCAERLGVPRGAGMFRQALQAVAFLNEEKIGAKMEYLMTTFRWFTAEASIAVRKNPGVLTKSKESLKHRSEFLCSKVGLEPVYIAH